MMTGRDEVHLFDIVTRKLFGELQHENSLALDKLLGCDEYEKWVLCLVAEEVPMCASCRQKLEQLNGPYGEVFHKMLLLEKADDNR
jgi:hypothetical protein